jgi:hypothetical protein
MRILWLIFFAVTRIISALCADIMTNILRMACGKRDASLFKHVRGRIQVVSNRAGQASVLLLFFLENSSCVVRVLDFTLMSGRAEGRGLRTEGEGKQIRMQRKF